MDLAAAKRAEECGSWRSRWSRQGSSGNVALTSIARNRGVRKLDEEQREFRDFLDGSGAKDRAEFDQFMNERRNSPCP